MTLYMRCTSPSPTFEFRNAIVSEGGVSKEFREDHFTSRPVNDICRLEVIEGW